jgi:biopolymer transport protein TolR
MSFDLKPAPPPLSDINVTPLVDVMLVLLVIFMVTAPMLSQGLPVNLPEAPAQSLVSQKPLVVSINRDLALYLDDRRVNLKELSAALAQTSSGPNVPEVLLKADREVPYGLVIQVMSALKQAGVEKLGLVTAPTSPKEATK